ncbi:MAG: phosphoribosyltransferase family protein [Candidatus Andersenbacteria bacterium]
MNYKITEQRARELLVEINAAHEGHFVYQAGDHGPGYLNKDDAFATPEALDELARGLAERFVNCGIEVVIGPAYGAIALCYAVALHLGRTEGRTVHAAYMIKIQEKPVKFQVKASLASYVAGKRALVVEDIVNSGDTIKAAVRDARTAGAIVEPCWRRGQPRRQHGRIGEVGVLCSLITVKMDKQPAEECELCRKDVPISTHLGHGKRYLEFLETGRPRTTAEYLQWLEEQSKK